MLVISYRGGGVLSLRPAPDAHPPKIASGLTLDCRRVTHRHPLIIPRTGYIILLARRSHTAVGRIHVTRTKVRVTSAASPIIRTIYTYRKRSHTSVRARGHLIICILYTRVSDGCTSH